MEDGGVQSLPELTRQYNNNSELTYSYIKSDNKRKEGGRREERPNEQKIDDHKGDEQVGTRQEQR